MRRELAKLFRFQAQQCGRCNGRRWVLRVRITAIGKDRCIERLSTLRTKPTVTGGMMGKQIKQFWAYRHIDRGIHVRQYRADLPNARESIDDAFESDFVDDVLDPFPAHDRAEAEQIAKTRLDNLKAAR